ncbi:hypothetical protein GCM10009799_49770 [Nocardiopsis rhodophaea]|uniref:VOC domain-containing protein n=1 Tax=Nocardiopsis rhodophaea TaxID=280238 RepID=A0ABN2TPD5_9ACTN
MADPPTEPTTEPPAEPPATPAIRGVVYPSADVADSIAFYRDGLGFTVTLVDGDHYAALDGRGTTLAITAQDDDVTSGAPAITVKVDDLSATLAALVDLGARVERAPETGAHETRAVVRDPAGHPVVIYTSRPT